MTLSAQLRLLELKGFGSRLFERQPEYWSRCYLRITCHDGRRDQ